MEPLWAPCLQPAAINGKSTERKSGENRPNPLRPVAPRCPRSSMVRRGSTVRVRRRALQKRITLALLWSEELALRRTCGRYGALEGAIRSKMPPQRRPFRSDQAAALREVSRAPLHVRFAGARRSLQATAAFAVRLATDGACFHVTLTRTTIASSSCSASASGRARASRRRAPP
jgi:hypothetical protein